MVAASTLSLKKCVELHQNKQWQEAIEGYKQLLDKTPELLAALVNLGALYRQSREFDLARECYERAVNVDPEFVEGWFNYGNLCMAANDLTEAESCYEQVLSRQPENVQALYQLSVVYREREQWQACRETLEQLIALNPEHTGTLLSLGNLWKQLGDSTKSQTYYLRVVEVDPTFWSGHYSLARWYDAEGETELFDQHIAKALEYAPSSWMVYHNLGQARFDIGKYATAAEAFECALRSSKNHETHLSKIALGSCFQRLDETTKARSCFTEAGKTDDISVLSNLARTIWEYKYFEETLTLLKQIVSLAPESPDAHLNLAKVYYESWRMSDAEKTIERALALRPDFVAAQDLLTTLLNRQGKVDQCLPLYRQRIERYGALSSSVSSYLFSELYSSSASAEEKFAHHKAYMDDWVEALAEPVSFDYPKDKTRRVKIGLVSADFRDQHPVGIFVQPLLEHIDKTAFSLTGYYTSQTFDDSTHLIRDRMDHWHDVAGWSDQRLRSKIMNDEIDILVDLSGHTSNHRLKLFAMRAAPIQVTWMAYPHSTGLSTVDYMIADPIVCPPENDHLCSETLCRLPSHSVFCFPPTSQFGEVDLTGAKERDALVFGSFNNLPKVNQETLNLWRDVLIAVPNSKLKLKTPSFTDKHCCEYYRDLFVSMGIDKDRLVFTGPSSLSDMMREYGEVDIALDTFPYNGGTTTFQALWMGVPVLTMAGDNFCGRMGASAMTHLGLEDWVASSRLNFVDRAVGFASDREGLLALKTGLRERMRNSPLCDAQGFGEEMGQIFREIWCRYCESDAVQK